jgi:valyl-tRNA synthetase/inosine/xanthosine triphosphate pyrophosphatase family protein
MPLASTYNPKDFEDKIYQKWQSSGVGSPENQNLVSTKPKVLFATTNHHKIKLFKLAWEYQGLDKQFDLVTLRDLDNTNLLKVVEDSGTFAGDATLKAIAYAKHFGLPTISQDRGFVFDALNWPGTDSKKVMFGNDDVTWNIDSEWESEMEMNTFRAQQAIDKLEDKDRSMRLIQGLAIALPDGRFASEEFATLGKASEKIVNKIGGAFDWFFIPNSLGHIMAEFDTQDLLDQWTSKNTYPITPEITSFLEKNVQDSNYAILMPPPNLTGDLHAGHAFQHYIMDTLTRVHRQKGQKSLWYPGVDHAGIQLEGVIDKLIKKDDFDEVLEQKIPEIKDIKIEDRPKWLKDTDPDLWTQLAWSKVNSWRDNQKKQSSVLGDTPDYSRSLFTLDDRANNMVNYAFEQYWKDGLIYKGSYLVNWSVGLQTAVSDVAGEIEYEKRVDPFITFEYRLKDISQIQYPDKNISSDQVPLGFEKLFDKRIKVSTVRPETIAGDVAIAIHPSKVASLFGLTEEEGKSFVSHLSNQNPSIKIFLENPINPNYITIIIADEVDPDFGTGALKITPASDIVDYEIFNKYIGGDFPRSIGRDGKLTEVCGENFAGLTVEQGRLAVIKTLIQTGYVPLKPESILDTDDIKKEIENRKAELDNFDPTNFSYAEGQKELKRILGDYIINELAIDWHYEHNVSICERSKTVIEPLISEEFFLSYHCELAGKDNQTLQQIGLEGIKETNFYPAELADRASNFLENIKDWCISRDLVWGHKMPIWYNLELNPNKVFYNFADYQNSPEIQKSFQISETKPDLPGNWAQEQKILDTWFSSCLWPLSTLGYYDYKHGKTGTDFENFYSTTDMISGADIFYQWIVRMMLVCKYFTGMVPYKNVILNPTVRDEQGRKMSKSLGNGLDAVAQIDKFSSDSLRLAMLSGMIPNRNFRLGGKIADKMCEKYRNFGNKLWNVARFLESR